MSSYCRWEDAVQELTPDVDVSIKKIEEIYKLGGADGWAQYVKDNGVIMSDAFVYRSPYGDGFVCEWNVDHPNENIKVDTAQEMAEYLTEELERGMRIPQFAIDLLLAEAKAYAAYLKGPEAWAAYKKKHLQKWF